MSLDQTLHFYYCGYSMAYVLNVAHWKGLAKIAISRQDEMIFFKLVWGNLLKFIRI